jgi:hypothetical protein
MRGFDVVIRGGTVYDGTGAEGRVADVGVKDGRIAAIGVLEPSGEEIDATGLAVAPGFIDIHSHSDYTLLMDPRAVSAIHQGVTTEVVGNCGFGCFPIRDPQQARRAIYGYSDDLPISWSSAGEYFENSRRAGRPSTCSASSRTDSCGWRRSAWPTAPPMRPNSPRCRCCCASRSTTAPGATRPGSSTPRSKRRARTS